MTSEKQRVFIPINIRIAQSPNRLFAVTRLNFPYNYPTPRLENTKSP